MKTFRIFAAAALLAASAGAFAHGGYYVPGPVINSDPAFMISIGTPGFSMAYGTGAYGYYGPPPYYALPYYPPTRVIVAPPPYPHKYKHHRHHYDDRWDGDGRYKSYRYRD